MLVCGACGGWLNGGGGIWVSGPEEPEAVGRLSPWLLSAFRVPLSVHRLVFPKRGEHGHWLAADANV